LQVTVSKLANIRNNGIKNINLNNVHSMTISFALASFSVSY